MRREHRAFVKGLQTLIRNSVCDGHFHNHIIKRPDILVSRLVRAGLFDKDAVLGRLKFGNMRRTGLNVTMRYLVWHEQAIKDFIEDKTDYDADEAFNVLCFGVIIAVMSGDTEAESPVIHRIADITSVLPPSMVHVLLASKANIQRLLSNVSTCQYV